VISDVSLSCRLAAFITTKEHCFVPQTSAFYSGNLGLASCIITDVYNGFSLLHTSTTIVPLEGQQIASLNKAIIHYHPFISLVANIT
jgi:hypothetical protein